MSTVVNRIIESSTYGEHNLKVVAAVILFLWWILDIAKKGLVVYRVMRYTLGKNQSDSVVYNISSSVPVTCRDLEILSYRHCLQAVDSFAGFERTDDSFVAVPKKMFPKVDISLNTPIASSNFPLYSFSRPNPTLKMAVGKMGDDLHAKPYSDFQDLNMLSSQGSNVFPIYSDNACNEFNGHMQVTTSAYVGVSIDANLLLSNIIRFSALRKEIASDVSELYKKFLMIIVLPTILVEWISYIRGKIWCQSNPTDIDMHQRCHTSLRDGTRNRMDQQLDTRQTDTITTPFRDDFYPETVGDNSAMDPFTCIIEQCNFINGLNLTDNETELQLPVSMDFHSDVDSIPYIILLKNRKIDLYKDINQSEGIERITKNLRKDFITDIDDVTGTLFICSEHKIQKMLLIANDRIYNPLKVFGSHTDPEEGQCIGCYSCLRSVIITPCGHCCLCENCAMKCRHVDKKCPMCRMEILNYIIIPVIEN